MKLILEGIDMANLEPVNWEEMEWEIVRLGVRRKVFHAKGCTVVLNAVEPGNQPKPHSHSHEQIVSGNCQVVGYGNGRIGRG